ncbi:methyl-accepting chemotaxis protein [Aquibacillus rhizosphaerae]|uniref:Methyl-accepting chemotaxis protein n=1 Tax=Aquibacillus rhizosphaerae TaxID=3051431 RepID=A0ABT7L3D4_9BACI|nr:methyl-accepting chemotaxis protein [Aquibacillus sp. LR5S19]MDL4840375.1 methyl-accepting chemotaxis protein [Aquibacillus sp. LR5S19]
MRIKQNLNKAFVWLKQQRKLVRTKLILMFLIILIVPGAIIGYFGYQQALDEVQDKMVKGIHSNLSLVESNASQFISLSTERFNQFSDIIEPALADENTEEINNHMQRFIEINPDFESIEVVYTDGSYIASPELENAEEYEPLNEEWYQAALETTDNIQFSNINQSETTGEYTTEIIKALPNNEGVLKMTLQLNTMIDAVKDARIGDTGSMFVLNANEQVVTGTGFFFEAGILAPGAPFEGIAIDESTSEEMNGIFKKETVMNDGERDLATELYQVTEPVSGWKVIGMIGVKDYKEAALPILHKVLIVIAVAVLVGIGLLVLTLRMVLQPLKKLQSGARSIRDGNLNEEITLTRKDEFGLLADDFNDMRASLKTMVTELNQTSSQLAGSSQAIQMSTEETSKSVQNVVETIQETSESAAAGAEATQQTSQVVDEMVKAMDTISESVNVIVSSVDKTDKDVINGSQTIDSVQSQMAKILDAVNDSTEMITKLSNLSNEASQMNNAIGDIAQQTNLLSLNASIEAARSGEHGRGFAVVANEILKLSDQSKNVAEGIGSSMSKMLELIEHATSMMKGSVQNEITEGQRRSSEAASAFVNIEQSTKLIVQQIQGIANVTQDISGKTQSVLGHMKELENLSDTSAASAQTTSAAAEEQMAAMEEIASASDQLATMATNLERIVKRFSI